MSNLRSAAMMAALLGALGPAGMPAVTPSEPERDKRPKDIANQYQVEAEKKRAKRRADCLNPTTPPPRTP